VPSITHLRLSPARGFTLIEIMVVLVILGLLAAIVVPSVLDRPDEARRVKVQQDLRGLMSALKLYRLDNFRYPTEEQGLAALTRRPADATGWKGPYIELLPDDPWGNPYRYANPARRGREVDVYSYGADGREGGSGVDKDIGAWDLQ
jgi:general secretion pathway protein G